MSEEQSQGPVRYEVADGVATSRSTTRRRRTASPTPMLDGLIAAFERARDDTDVRCVVLASTDPKTFSSGGNLATFGADVAARPQARRHGALPAASSC